MNVNVDVSSFDAVVQVNLDQTWNIMHMSESERYLSLWGYRRLGYRRL
jgi:hypothetical protein